MRVLVTGAQGFIGAQLAAALAAAGHTVVRAGRNPPATPWPPDAGWLACDYARDTDPALWQQRLAGFDAVVNSVGLLREADGNHYDTVHRATPIALFTAAQALGLRVVQISALGDPATGFIASKWEADNWLLQRATPSVVIRPSVVYSPHGSYGGTSLIRALAGFPFVLPGFAGGSPLLQPIAVQDLARATVRAVEMPLEAPLLIEAVGAEAMPAEDFLAELRGWLGLPPARRLALPRPLIRLGMRLGDLIDRGPMGETLYSLLSYGNAGSAGALAHFEQQLGFKPLGVREALARAPAQVQDRWHVRLYQLQPLLTAILAIVWIASGIVGLITPPQVSADLLLRAHLPPAWGPPMAWFASGVDLLLGFWLVFGNRAAAWLMLVQLVAYTAFFGFMVPALWIEPLGGLLKNLIFIPAILIWLALDDSR